MSKVRVTVDLHPVRCPCGSTWYATPALHPLYDRCPDCNERALPGRIGPIEPCEIDVKPTLRVGGKIFV